MLISVLNKLLGDHSGGGTPVPIPNTVVKPASADGTSSSGAGRVGRCQAKICKPRTNTVRGLLFIF